MLEAARILAVVAVILLVLAIAAWATPLRPAQLRRPNGSAVANGGSLQVAASLLLAAVAFSAGGAILAITGWFST
jgi:hypothetical protein